MCSLRERFRTVYYTYLTTDAENVRSCRREETTRLPFLPLRWTVVASVFLLCWFTRAAALSGHYS